MKHILRAGVAAVLLSVSAVSAQSADKILNSSYDIARELYADINASFIPAHKAATGKDVTVDQSHGGSSAQARSITEGLEADVVTFNQVTDIDFLAQSGFVDPAWKERLPNNASPYYSFPSFLVREGNPKNIVNWEDLRQCALYLPGRDRLRAGSVRWRRGKGHRIRQQDL
jgi:sulfate transport system substrate-binding protein